MKKMNFVLPVSMIGIGFLIIGILYLPMFQFLIQKNIFWIGLLFVFFGVAGLLEDGIEYIIQYINEE